MQQKLEKKKNQNTAQTNGILACVFHVNTIFQEDFHYFERNGVNFLYNDCFLYNFIIDPIWVVETNTLKKVYCNSSILLRWELSARIYVKKEFKFLSNFTEKSKQGIIRC